ncbi:hypothetical protein D910_05134 [Dendroctonus ponderosae]
MPSWDSLKLPDKPDLAEINCKDLSPLSYYDPPLDSQYSWGTNPNTYPFGLKPNNYSSCAQVGKYCEATATTGYCSIQKNIPDISTSPNEVYKSCAYYSGGVNQESNQNLYGKCTAYYNTYSDASLEACNYYEPSVFAKQTPANHAFDLDCPPSEGSNEESDIVVEDSSSTDREYQEQIPSHCFVCRMKVRTVGLQFYVLTAQSPLTISSQIPVKDKIIKLIRRTASKDSGHLCNDCLGLVNSIDHLQFKLDSLVESLLKKSGTQQPTGVRISKKSQFKCKKCSKVLSVRSMLDRHTKRHKLAGYLCQLCGRQLATAKHLKHHLKLHSRPKNALAGFHCSNCPKICRTKFQIKEHENFCLGVLPFRCNSTDCGKKFASATKLRNHIKLKHDKKFVSICSICNMGFVKMSDYKSHMTSHSVEKKFSCDQCNKAYKTLTNLNFHRKSHAKILPFICTICQKGFMRREYHEAHMNNHKGIKSFECSMCTKKFVCQKNLDAHLKHHETKSGTTSTYEKAVCPGVHPKLDLNPIDSQFNRKSKRRKSHEKNEAGANS